MRAGWVRCALLCGLVCTFSVAASGCTMGGKSFSIDSNSRIPFFGLELKERKPKVNAPSFNSISRADADSSRIESALQIRSSTSLSLLNSRNKRQTMMSISGDGYEPASSVSKCVADSNSEVTDSIPIPVTESNRLPSERPASLGAVDFQ